jgi:hypothetical protein
MPQWRPARRDLLQQEPTDEAHSHLVTHPAHPESPEQVPSGTFPVVRCYPNVSAITGIVRFQIGLGSLSRTWRPPIFS